jgi:hypothetical protein
MKRIGKQVVHSFFYLRFLPERPPRRYVRVWHCGETVNARDQMIATSNFGMFCTTQATHGQTFCLPRTRRIEHALGVVRSGFRSCAQRVMGKIHFHATDLPA